MIVLEKFKLDKNKKSKVKVNRNKTYERRYDFILMKIILRIWLNCTYIINLLTYEIGHNEICVLSLYRL